MSKAKKAGISAVLTLFVITAIMSFLLAVVNGITKDRIDQHEEEKTRAALSGVLADGVTLGEKTEDFQDGTGLVKAVYGSTDGYVVEVAPVGYGGAISMVVGVNSQLEVTGVEIISQTETSGLGANAAKGAKGEAFRSQYVGQSGELAVVKDGGTIDALTGATVTSRAVTKGVNAALACAEALQGGAK